MDMQLLLESLLSLPLHLLPGLVLLRRRDRSGAVVCLGLAALLVLRGVALAGGVAAGIISLLSILFTLLWAAAVVLAGRAAAFRPLKKGSPLPVLCRVLGAVTLLGGGLLLVSYRSSSTFRILFSRGTSADQAYAAQLIITSAIQIAAGGFLLAAPALRPRPGMIWAGIMAAAVLAPPSLLNLFYALGFAGFSALVPTILGYALALPVLLQPAPSPAEAAAPTPAAGEAPPTARLRCVSGQFAGAEFPLQDGETLCLGSDPELAHIVLAQGGVAPLHAEVTYQRAQGDFLLAHTPENAVCCGDRPTPPVSRVVHGDCICFGSPRQCFAVEIYD